MLKNIGSKLCSSGAGQQPVEHAMERLIDRSAPAGQVRKPFFCAAGRRSNSLFDERSLKKVHAAQIEKFRAHAAQGAWNQIHNDHFDWYMFPIEDGSQPEFNVYEDDVSRLRADEKWLADYREGVAIVLQAWGWDAAARQLVEPLAEGQGWTDWDVRLAKMTRSLWLFCEKDMLESIQHFARQLKPNGGL